MRGCCVCFGNHTKFTLDLFIHSILIAFYNCVVCILCVCAITALLPRPASTCDSKEIKREKMFNFVGSAELNGFMN